MSHKLSAPRDSPIGFAALMELFDGSFQAVSTLLDVASTSIAQDVRRIEEGILESDMTAVAVAAHRLKGTSGSISAERLTAISSAVERDARRHSLSNASGLLPELHAARDSLTAEIASFERDALGAQAPEPR